MIITRAEESGHWYQIDGAPAYYITAKSGEQRSTTLRDARKLNLLPSVTTIIKCAASPGLEAWKLNQMLLAALTLPKIDGEPEESFVQRIVKDSKEHAKQAAERGSEIHAAIETFYEGIMLANMAEYQVGVAQSIEETFGRLDFKSEKSFASKYGFGGKVDLHAENVVIDLKTKEFTDPKDVQAYPDNAMQLAAYRVGLGMPNAVCANVFISVTEPGLVVIKKWSEEDLQKHWLMFFSLLNFWKLKNNYEPPTSISVVNSEGIIEAS